MRKAVRFFFLSILILAPLSKTFAWHDTGHMLVAQVAYLKLTPAAKAKVDSLLVTLPDKRPLIHLCAGYYTRETCEKTYDPITIAVWMDDFRGDSLTDDYDPWHYINYNPFFDGTPVRSNVGPLPVNILDRINWSVNTLRTGTGRAKTDAEVLGFLYHLVGDVHQPLHAATRYTAARPDGDAGGNGFSLKTTPESPARNLHFYWDAAAGLFNYESPKRPLDDAARAKIRQIADDLMRKYPEANLKDVRETEPLVWVKESNTIAREFAYVKVRENETPSKQYMTDAQRISEQRLTLAGYRLAAVLNMLFSENVATRP